MQGRVCQDGHTLLEALDLNARCSERFAKLFTYANCHYDAEMANPGYKKLYETIFGENSAAAQRTAFLMPELMGLTRERFDALCACWMSAASRCWRRCWTSTPPSIKSTAT